MLTRNGVRWRRCANATRTRSSADKPRPLVIEHLFDMRPSHAVPQFFHRPLAPSQVMAPLVRSGRTKGRQRRATPSEKRPNPRRARLWEYPLETASTAVVELNVTTLSARDKSSAKGTGRKHRPNRARRRFLRVRSVYHLVAKVEQLFGLLLGPGDDVYAVERRVAGHLTNEQCVIAAVPPRPKVMGKQSFPSLSTIPRRRESTPVVEAVHG